MSDWERPYPPDASMILSGILLAAGVSATAAFTVILVTDQRIGPLGIPIYIFAALWLAMMWRLYRAGILYNSEGIQIRHLIRTQTLLWTQVAEVASQPALLMGLNTGREAIWVTTRDGKPIETPVQCSRGLRLGFYKNNGRVLNPANYQRALKTLQDRLARSGRRVTPFA